MQKFKLVVLEKHESENQDVITETFFGFSTAQESEAKKHSVFS